MTTRLQTLLSEAIANMEKMIALEQEQIRLQQQLIRALHLAKLLNKKPSDIGKIRTHTVDGGYYRMPWKGAAFTVKEEGQEPVSFPIMDVPRALWPATMRADYDKWAARTR